MKYIPPSTDKASFNCAHCGVLTTQYWFRAYSAKIDKGGTPQLIGVNDATDYSFREIQDAEKRAHFAKLVEGLRSQKPFQWRGEDNLYDAVIFENLNISRCYACNDLSIWVADKMMYPATGEAPPPNPDLSDDIKRDYLEASSILHLSPRSAAALIRLCLQKLCKELGESGENINADIKSLVQKGLSVKIQQALDAIRVIGNNAVHPLEMDIRDDRAIAETMFRLLNLIAEKMISEDKHVEEAYAKLPPDALAKIAKRDASAK